MGLAAQQQLARLEERRAGGSRRWNALESELSGLRAEEARQRTRVQSLRREHTDTLRAAESRIAQLKKQVRAISGTAAKTGENEVCEENAGKTVSPSMDTSSDCAALLLS